MTWRIIRKEILGNLLSLRFILSMLLAVLLFALGGFVFVDGYRQQSQDYWQDTNKNLSALSANSKQLYELALRAQQIWRKPKPLTLCAEGFEKSIPNSFEFNVFTIQDPQVKNRSNFVLARFSDVDWAFVISLVFTFAALLFTYDCICGEKEAGTLPLWLANSIPRHKILLGKHLGVMLTLGIPLLLGLLVNLIIAVFSLNVRFSGADWAKMLAIVLLSFLYLSVFVSLGIFISSRTVRSTNSMVLLLLVWVSLVVLIPGFGRIVSNAFHKLPAKADLDRRVRETADGIVQSAFADKYGKNALVYHPDVTRSDINPPATARFRNAMTHAVNRILEDRLKQMMAQASAGRKFTCISPAVVYQRASEAIAGTGVNRFKSLYQQIKAYQEDLRECIRTKDLEDPDSLHLLFPGEKEMEHWKTISHKPVDFGTVPKFQERDLALGESLQLAIWDIGLLVLFNLVFFTAAFVSFLKYDVR